jgi:hypothetical protein
MSNTGRWVTDARARGGRVLVETLDYKPSAKKRKAKREEAFALVPLARAAEITKCMRAKGTMVWIVLVYLAWKNKSPTVQLSNEAVRRYGVSRHAKYRALITLEAAGIVSVKWRHKQAPMVTLIQ